MKAIFLHVIISILTATLFVSCGKKQQEEGGKKNNVQVLETGDSFLSAPQVWVDFGSVTKGKNAQRVLSFEADRKGNLILSKNTFGMGRGCVDSNGKNDYEVSYKYKRRKVGEDSFRELVPERKDYESPTFDRIDLDEGDLLHITLILKPLVSCSLIEIIIYAQF